MGTYLVTGIVEEICIAKKQCKNISIDNITSRLKEELELNYYDYKEDDEGYYWQIKPGVLEGDLKNFLQEQFQMYTNNNLSKEMEEVLEELNRLKSADQRVRLAKEKKFSNYQFIPQIIEYVSVIKNNGFEESIMIFYSLIIYFMDGKIITEGCEKSLRYFERSIRLQKDHYPVVDCIKVMFTS